MTRKILCASASAALLLALAGCGGGGGGGGSESVNYDGATNAAVIDTTGAVATARDTTLDLIGSGSYADTGIIPLAAPPRGLDRFRDPDEVTGLLLGALGVGPAVQPADLLSVPAEPLVYQCVDVSARAGDVSGFVSGRVCGDYDMGTQEFTTVDYIRGAFVDFSNDDVVYLDGTIILDARDVPLTIIFRDFYLYDGDSGEDLFLDGIVTTEESGAVTTVVLNLFIFDFVEMDGRWFNDLTLVEEDFGTYRTVTVDGRVYDHVHGYVDVDTTEPFTIDLGAEYPDDGTVKLTGEAGRSITLAAEESGFMVYVDLTADGVSDWQTSSPVPWE